MSVIAEYTYMYLQDKAVGMLHCVEVNTVVHIVHTHDLLNQMNGSFE